MKQVFKAQMSSSIEQILLYQMLICYTIKAIRTNVKWTIFVGPNVVYQMFIEQKMFTHSVLDHIF